jgi:hypothetical protein
MTVLRSAQERGAVVLRWFGDDENGHGLVIVETEEQAKLRVRQVGEVFRFSVTSSPVYRLNAEA